MTGREGTVVGPYRLTRLLGSGGAGDVYLAEGPAHGGQAGIAAVKVLRGEASDPTAIAMLRQAQAIAELHQPHILPIYKAQRANSSVYIAMTYAPGGSLGTAIEGTTSSVVQLPLAGGVVARLVNQVARALQTLHERGTVHGDLKPNNLFVRTARQGGPMVAVADFGQTVVMRAAAQAAASGTPWAAAAIQCAAPEQLRGEVSPSSDQYALATIAYLLLTGTYPFTGDAHTMGETILSSPPAPPSSLDPGLSPVAEAALLRALSKSPRARFPDISTFAQALDDGLAASRAAGVGVTQEFSALGGPSRAGTPPHTPAGAASSATLGRYMDGSSSRSPRRADNDAAMPNARHAAPGRAPQPGGQIVAPQRGLTPRRRAAALIGGVFLVAVLIAGVYGISLMFKGGASAGLLPNFGGLNYAPTITPNAVAQATATAIARSADTRLAATTATRPVFSDTLDSNAQHWQVDNKNTFFAADGRLHLYNHDVNSVLSLDQPATVPANFAVSVSLSFLHGGASDLAGIRVRVTSVGNGKYSHITALISPDGRYEVWRYNGTAWTVLDFGYTQSIVRGMNQTNTLSILAEAGDIRVFINQQFVSSVADPGPAAAGATAMGLTVVYAGTEVAYSHYAVYSAGD